MFPFFLLVCLFVCNIFFVFWSIYGVQISLKNTMSICLVLWCSLKLYHTHTHTWSFSQGFWIGTLKINKTIILQSGTAVEAVAHDKRMGTRKRRQRARKYRNAASKRPTDRPTKNKLNVSDRITKCLTRVVCATVLLKRTVAQEWKRRFEFDKQHQIKIESRLAKKDNIFLLCVPCLISAVAFYTHKKAHQHDEYPIV